MSRTETIVKDANAVSMQDLCTAMASAFSDYAVPINLTLPAFSFMMQQRGLSPEASRIAIVDGEVAAIWLVSVRDGASYLISSGTIPEYRGRGLATDLAEASLSHLRQNAVATFQTEVLVENTTAFGLYEKLGMKKHRDLSCYIITGPKPSAATPEINEVPWSEIASATQSLQDWPPSWQNSAHSVAAIADDIRCFCTHDDTTLTGYAALAPGSGNLHQIGVQPDARRQGIGTALINHALTVSDGPLRLINADAADTGFAAFVRSFPHEQTQGQFELLMPL
ncbi:GNAT family N-acetyltransferase [Cognatiyoonia sp. IB215182]|uniref:GNAT family N-acetyltransferase n=1 Tax=Cognatiyoonia sp. IB215182 TaxID=3097353 RepID=UPI002A0C0D43|nr:GNAT family N-acetyltransferase [Cognatiyoonia sp. IB215182]MDX8351891.1 GNAT family N-acetyltransferase [Cognatiyoonia sp. IB215182]